MLYQTETAQALSLLWHLHNLVFQFHRLYPTSRKSKLGSKWAGFEIPSSEVGWSTLLTWRFLRPDRVGTHTTQIIPTAECSAAEISTLLVVQHAENKEGSQVRDPDTGYREDKIKMNFKQTGTRLWTRINALMEKFC
jgi:hypothetical protein